MTKSIITTVFFLNIGICLSQSNTISPLAYKEPTEEDNVSLGNISNNIAYENYYDIIKLELAKSFLLASNSRINKDRLINQTIDTKGLSINEKKLTFNPLGNKKIIVTSKFGYRIHPITGKYHFHNGIDLSCFYEPIYSVIDGIVEVGEDNRSGKYIVIENPETKLRVIYCHLSSILVNHGEYVTTGKGIGVSGNSGSSTGPHLHFSVKLGGVYINPNNIIDLIF